MEAANRALSSLMKAKNNNTLINICLGLSFAALCFRSVNQSKEIEALEAERDSLVKSNKALKKTMWDWKEQLFAEASSESALIPLDRLKAIYGESQTPSIGNTVREDANSESTKFVV